MFAAGKVFFTKSVALSGGFDPLSLSPSLWLDASDSATLYDATTGGSLVAADGTVARWEDKSGNARHATQATLGYRPLRKTAVQNGKDILRFTSATFNHFVLPNFLSGVAGTAIYVFKNVSDPPGGEGESGAPLTDFGSDSNANHMPWVDGNIYDDFGSTVRKTVGNPTPSFTSTKLVSQISVINDWRFYIDGSLFYSTVTNTVGWGTTPLIGKTFGGSGSYNFWGDIAEVLVFPTALSDTDRAAVEAYLSAKWGI